MQRFVSSLLLLWALVVAVTSGLSAQPSSLRTRNEQTLQTLKVEKAAALRILDDPRVSSIDLAERIAELREAVGLTRVSLKTYLTAYPDVCIGLFVDKVKTAKSVVMRVLRVSEQQYAAALKRIPLQTNNKAGAIFRGNFPFIVASLRDMAGLSDKDLTFLFNTYPTIFTLDYRTVISHLNFLRKSMGYSQEQVRLLLLRNCRSALCGKERAAELALYFERELGLSAEQFCVLSVAHPRIFGVSLTKTLRPKIQQLLDEESWGLTRDRLADVIQRAPSVLTTPASTTRKVWRFMREELSLPTADCQTVVRKYPNLLRVNLRSLTPKLCLLAVAEIGLMLVPLQQQEQQPPRTAASLPLSEASRGFHDQARDLFADVAAELLKRAPVALTCSSERIRSRMLALDAHRGVEAVEAASAVGFSVRRATTTSVPQMLSLEQRQQESEQEEQEEQEDHIAVGVAALENLLQGDADLLQRLCNQWRLSKGRSDSFPVSPSVITLSDKKFEEKFAQMRGKKEPSL